jgi:hypothetical protein
VKSIYERRNGLPLSPLPAEVRKKMETRQANISGEVAVRKLRAQKVLAEIAAEQSAEEAADVERLKLRYQNLFS